MPLRAGGDDGRDGIVLPEGSVHRPYPMAVMRTQGSGLIVLPVRLLTVTISLPGSSSSAILVVDDDPLVRAVAVDALEDEGFEVTATTSAWSVLLPRERHEQGGDDEVPRPGSLAAPFPFPPPGKGCASWGSRMWQGKGAPLEQWSGAQSTEAGQGDLRERRLPPQEINRTYSSTFLRRPGFGRHVPAGAWPTCACHCRTPWGGSLAFRVWPRCSSCRRLSPVTGRA